MKFVIIGCIFICGIINTSAYVFNRGYGGLFIKWATNKSNIQFYLNTSNNDGLSNSTVKTIVNSAASEWNLQSPLSISIIETTSSNGSNQNDISFTSSDSWYSDASIVGVTQVVYDSTTGVISETDIHINDFSHNLSSLISEKLYLGNVVAHELGHAIGLDHSQVNKSTMYFQNQKGQSTLSDDDGSGAYSLYGTINDKGSISGKIIGGANLTSVFGAHVSAISQTTGQIAAGTISESDGTFIISGLDLNSTYYIYVEPSKALSTIPFYYQVRRANFCENGQDYQGSFFQGCLSRDKGYPQGVSLTSTNKSPYVGSITIRCGVDVPTDYMMNKPSQVNVLDVFSENATAAYIGESMVGYFSPNEVLTNTEDVFSIDLTSVNLSSYTNTNLSNLYLEVKTIHQALFSKVKLQVDIQDSIGSTIAINPASLVIYSTEDNLPMLDTTTRVPLNSLASLNDFKIVITPSDNSLDTIFANLSDFTDERGHYLFLVSVVREVSPGIYLEVSGKHWDIISDNKMCPDASQTYVVAGDTTDASSIEPIQKTKSDLPIACGSISYPNDTPPSTGPFIVALFVMLITLFNITRVKLSTYEHK